MSMTNAEKKRIAKRKAKERSKRRTANVLRNTPARKYRLDVELDGKWHKGVMRFRDIHGVEAYRARTEAKRKAGEEIAPGRVTNVDTDQVVLEIPGSKPKGTLPDAITDGPKADPAVTAEPKQEPAEAVAETKEEVPTEKVAGLG